MLAIGLQIAFTISIKNYLLKRVYAKATLQHLVPYEAYMLPLGLQIAYTISIKILFFEKSVC
jgi:hypothetical protein